MEPTTCSFPKIRPKIGTHTLSLRLRLNHPEKPGNMNMGQACLLFKSGVASSRLASFCTYPVRALNPPHSIRTATLKCHTPNHESVVRTSNLRSLCIDYVPCAKYGPIRRNPPAEGNQPTGPTILHKDPPGTIAYTCTYTHTHTYTYGWLSKLWSPFGSPKY